MRRYLPKNTEELLRFYERYVSPISLIAGFISDNLILLRRVDLWTTDALFLFYLCIAASGIVFLNLAETGRVTNRALQKATPFVPIAMQFAFGGLFSGFLSLYSRSASFAMSWVFVVAIALLLLGNERFTRLYTRFSFQVSLFFFTLFSFLIFFLPVVFKQIGPIMFLESGAVSLAVIALFLLLLRRLVPDIVKKQIRTVRFSIAGILILFNALYFSSAIPPLPLAIKEAGVYHSIERSSDSYTLSYEPLPWYEQYLNYNMVYHRAPGEPVYVWTAVFAPSGLTTTILHEWQYYDPASKSWQTIAEIPFLISGGRDGGYRGYSEVSNPKDGSWRVNVVTQYGQTISRISFTIESASSTPQLLQASR